MSHSCGYTGCTRADVTRWFLAHHTETTRFAAEKSPPLGSDGAPRPTAVGVSWNSYVGSWQALAKTVRSFPPRLMHVGYFTTYDHAASALDKFVAGQDTPATPEKYDERDCITTPPADVDDDYDPGQNAAQDEE